MKTVSLIIVNYNGKRFLKRLLDSIREQTLQDFEVIFVDNDSKDDSIEFIKNNYPEVIIILSKNNGFGSACNLGVKKATGKYVAFFNEDMYFPKDFLQKIISFRESKKTEEKIGGVSCKIIDFDSDSNLTLPTYGARIDILGFTTKSKNKNDNFSISACPFLIEKILFEKIGGFNEMIFIYGEDSDLSWRLKIFGYENYTTNNTYLYHFAGGATGNFGPKKMADIVYGGFVSIFDNYGLVMLIIFLPLFCVFSVLFYILITLLKLDLKYFLEIIRKKIYFIKNFKKALKFRKFVQAGRKKGDCQIIKNISLVPAFFINGSLGKVGKNYKVKNV